MDLPATNLRKLFWMLGNFCVHYQWEIILSCVAFCILLFRFADPHPSSATETLLPDNNLIVSTVVTFVALISLYSSLIQLRTGVNSTMLFWVVLVFRAMVLALFSAIALYYTHRTPAELLQLLPFALLLSNTKNWASVFAEKVLRAHNINEVRTNILQSMALLGPGITLDTLVEMLFIAMGYLAGIPQLAHICYYSCIAIFVNYVVLIFVFPAFLSLALEVYSVEITGEQTTDKINSNPLMFRLKLITVMGLSATHLLAYTILGTYYTFPLNCTNQIEPLDNEPQITFEKSWLTHEVITVAVAILFFLRYALFGKSSKTALQASKMSEEDATDSAVCADSVQPVSNGSIKPAPNGVIKPIPNDTVNGSTARKRNRPRNGFINGAVTNGVIPEHSNDAMSRVSCMRQLIANKLEYLKASTTSCSSDDVLTESNNLDGSNLRPLEECSVLLKASGGAELTDEEIMLLVNAKQVSAYKLEGVLGDHERGVNIRRKMLSSKLADQDALSTLPYTDYDYSMVTGACCENVIGYMPIPVGVAGPLVLDGRRYEVPMATTEGCLVASTNRGCRALSGGIYSYLLGDGMTRGPVVRCNSAGKASEIKLWLEKGENYKQIEDIFNSTSRFARLKSIQSAVAGRLLFIRFKAVTGDAMGMNMISKGVEKSLNFLQQEYFAEMEILSLSGNYCTDKKPSAVNWIDGRGKSIVCEAIVPGKVVKEILKTEVQSLVELNISKNLVGSAMAGSIGGFNAHAANLVTAIYIATGQDPAQNVGSSNCLTLMEASGPMGEDLYMSCTMPCIEIGTVGGGTVLLPQSACLKMLGVYGPNLETPGENANQLARIICATVMAGELSLLSALAAGHLVRSHLTHNRSKLNLYSQSSQQSSCSQLEETIAEQDETPTGDKQPLLRPLFTL